MKVSTVPARPVKAAPCTACAPLAWESSRSVRGLSGSLLCRQEMGAEAPGEGLGTGHSVLIPLPWDLCLVSRKQNVSHLASSPGHLPGVDGGRRLLPGKLWAGGQPLTQAVCPALPFHQFLCELDRWSTVMMSAASSLPATEVSDTICDPCPVGFFSNVSSALEKCHPWTRYKDPSLGFLALRGVWDHIHSL